MADLFTTKELILLALDYGIKLAGVFILILIWRMNQSDNAQKEEKARSSAIDSQLFKEKEELGREVSEIKGHLDGLEKGLTIKESGK